MKFFILFIIFIFSYSQTVKNSLRLSFQNIHFNKENLGLFETSYLFHYKYLYSGISIYSAITGKRGGFFVGGITAGLNYPIYKKIFLDGGVFIGGGGGGHAPQGSGLMTKLYAGVIQKNKVFSYGFNINHIFFKDSPIKSTQLGITFDYYFKDVIFFNLPKKNYGYYGIEQLTFSPFIITYFPFNSKNTSNKKQKNFSILGAEINKKYDNYSLLLSAGGAFQGSSDGYAEYLIGISKNINNILLKVLVGAGGGGKVKTKGGFIYKLQAQTNFKYLNPTIGYMQAIRGIKSFYGGLYLQKKFNLITIGNKYLHFKPQKFNIKIYNDSYLSAQTKNNIKKRVDTLNIDFGLYKKNNLAFIITTGTAYNGNSGGYAIGLFGIQYNINPYIFTKISVGAAGGGNIDVGGGLIAKADFGIKYKNIFISIGKIKSFNGMLNSNTISFGINFDFYKGIVK